MSLGPPVNFQHIRLEARECLHFPLSRSLSCPCQLTSDTLFTELAAVRLYGHFVMHQKKFSLSVLELVRQRGICNTYVVVCEREKEVVAEPKRCARTHTHKHTRAHTKI